MSDGTNESDIKHSHLPITQCEASFGNAIQLLEPGETLALAERYRLKWISLEDLTKVYPKDEDLGRPDAWDKIEQLQAIIQRPDYGRVDAADMVRLFDVCREMLGGSFRQVGRVHAHSAFIRRMDEEFLCIDLMVLPTFYRPGQIWELVAGDYSEWALTFCVVQMWPNHPLFGAIEPGWFSDRWKVPMGNSDEALSYYRDAILLTLKERWDQLPSQEQGSVLWQRFETDWANAAQRMSERANPPVAG